MRRIAAGAAWLSALVAFAPFTSRAADECSQLGAASLPQCAARLNKKDSGPEGSALVQAAAQDEVAGRSDAALGKYEKARPLLAASERAKDFAQLIEVVDKKILELRSGAKTMSISEGASPRTATARVAKPSPPTEIDPLEPEPRSVGLELADGSRVLYAPSIDQSCEVYRDGAPYRSCDPDLQNRVRRMFGDLYDDWQSCLWAKGKRRPESLSGELPTGSLGKCRNPESKQVAAQAEQTTAGPAGPDIAAPVVQDLAAASAALPRRLALAQPPQPRAGAGGAGTAGAPTGGIVSTAPASNFDSSGSTISGTGLAAATGRQPGASPQTSVLQPVSAAPATAATTCVKDPSWTGWIKRTGPDGSELTYFGEQRRCEVTATGASCDGAQANHMLIEWWGVLKKQMDRSSPCKGPDEVSSNMVDARPSKVSFEMGGDCVRDPDFTNEVTDAYGTSGGLLYNRTTGSCTELASGKGCDAPRLAHMEARWEIKVAAARAKYPSCDAGYRPRASLPQQAAAPAPVRSLFAQQISGASIAPRAPVTKPVKAAAAKPKLVKPSAARVLVARSRPPRVRSIATYDDDPESSYSAPSGGGYSGPSAGDVVSGLLSVAGAVLPVAAALAGGRVGSTPSYSAPRTVYRPPQTSYPAGPGPSRSGISGTR